MKISNFVWLLTVIIVIAIISLLYTSATNEDVIQEVPDYEAMDAQIQESIQEDLANTLEEPNTLEDSSIEFFNYFEHTAPGQYSEIFVEIIGFEPNVQKIVYVRNADTKEYISSGGQDLVTTELGHISTRFTIYSYGNYEVVTYDDSGNEVVSPLLVVN